MAKTRRNSDDQKTIARRLVLTREALEQGQVQIARFLEISPQRLNNYERGFRPLDIDVAKKLVPRWKVTLDWLYLGDDSGLPKRVADAIARHDGDTSKKR